MKNFEGANSSRVATEELVSCPNCQSNDLRIWRRGYDQLNELKQQQFIYSQCQTCNLVFLSLRPVEAEIHHFYPEDYEPYQPQQFQPSLSNPDLAAKNIFKANWLKISSKKILNKILELYQLMITSIFPESFEQQLQKFYEPAKVGSTLLDFGCGSEQFLDTAREKGWNPIGIDFSESVVARVRDRGHKALLMSPGVWDEIENESLDLVRINHVLEHLYHPKEDLQTIYTKMKPGAKLHIAVPNPDGVASRIFRSNWWGLECPRHIMLYPPALLAKILAETKYSQIETFYRSIVKDFLRSCGYVLYNLRLISHDRVGKMAQKRYLTVLLYPFARLSSAFAVADRFDVFCEK